MADVSEPFELCKVLQNGSLVGISRHAEDDHVLLTLRDRGVLVYNLQHQKLISSWSVEQRDNVTCAAVHNRTDRSFVMVVNKSEIFLWEETDSDLKQCQRIQSDKEIFSLLVWNSLKSDPLVIFKDGCSMPITDIITASENKRVKRRRAAKSSQDFNLAWTFAYQYQNQPYSAVIGTQDKRKYVLKVTNHGHSSAEKKATVFEVPPPAEDAMLLSCCVCEEGHCITSYWSDGSLCVTELEAVLQCVQSDTSDKSSSVTCRRVQRLQPLQTGSSKNRGSVALAAVDADHVCLCGSTVVDGKLKDVIMVWNIRYGTLQSWQTLDKLTARQSSLGRVSQTTGACSACSIPGFICVGFCHSVAVCQLSLDACSLASALGQLDSTAKQPPSFSLTAKLQESTATCMFSRFLKDEGLKPELLVTLKLAKPGQDLKCWPETIEKEDHVEKEVLEKLIDPSKTPTEEMFSSELTNYMKLKLSKQDDKPDASHPSEAGTSKATPIPFVGKSGKKTEVLSQPFISTVLSRCISEKSFWARECVSELLKTKCVPSSSSKELLNCIMEKNDSELLKQCFENIKGIPEDTVVLCLRHVLRQERSARKEKETGCSQTEDHGVNQMPLDKTRVKYLCSILSYPVNDVFLLACLKQLSFEDVLLLLKFFMYLMHRGLAGFQDVVDCKTLTYPQVLDWAGLVLNAHYTQLVITPEAHELLVRYHEIVSQQVRTYGKLRSLEGFLEHFNKRKPLPKAEKVGLYAIEVLEM